VQGSAIIMSGNNFKTNSSADQPQLPLMLECNQCQVWWSDHNGDVSCWICGQFGSPAGRIFDSNGIIILVDQER
jgi:hypothetical protein